VITAILKKRIFLLNYFYFLKSAFAKNKCKDSHSTLFDKSCFDFLQIISFRFRTKRGIFELITIQLYNYWTNPPELHFILVRKEKTTLKRNGCNRCFSWLQMQKFALQLFWAYNNKQQNIFEINWNNFFSLQLT